MMTNPGIGISSNEPEVMMDINTTPLIDVMLVLLIMLIITIPIQLHTVNLDMPVAAPPSKKVDPIVIKIDVAASGTITWNGDTVTSREDLQSRLNGVKAADVKPEIHIRADAKAKYELVAAVLASAQRTGLTKLGIVGSERFAN